MRCFAVVSTAHPWEQATCTCGSVTVSGLPWRPRVDWSTLSPGGWSFVDEDTAEDQEAAEGEEAAEGDHEGARDQARTPYGFAQAHLRRHQ